MKNYFSMILCGVCFLLVSLAQAEVSRLEKVQLIISLDEESLLSHASVGMIHRKKIEIRDKFSGKILDYYTDNPDLSGLAEIEIVIKKGVMEKSISWPYMDLENLKNFFRGKEAANCAGLVNLIKGNNVADFRLFEKNWFPVENNSLVAGDIIALSKDVDSSSADHYAVYLGEDLYLSKYGAIEKLIVVTLEEMKSNHKSKSARVFRGIP